VPLFLRPHDTEGIEMPTEKTDAEFVLEALRYQNTAIRNEHKRLSKATTDGMRKKREQEAEKRAAETTKFSTDYLNRR
jgi:hypothetical protein